jgi:hypothetical protein
MVTDDSPAFSGFQRTGLLGANKKNRATIPAFLMPEIKPKRRWMICRQKIKPVRPVRDRAPEKAGGNAHQAVPEKAVVQVVARDAGKVAAVVPERVLDKAREEKIIINLMEVKIMPGFDRRGPNGLGPMTGGMRGYCNPEAAGYRPSFSAGQRFGRGMGLGRGFRGGMVRRIKGGFGYPPPVAGQHPDDSAAELDGLKAQADTLQNSLDAISKRIAAMEKRFD